MQDAKSLKVTAASHYCIEYYGKWDCRFRHVSLFTGSLGTTASVGSKLSRKMLISWSSRLAAILGTSTTGLLFTAIVPPI